MKRAKKFLAIILAVAMVIGMNAMVYAAAPVPGDQAEITISGLEPGVTVKLYKVVKGVYGNGGTSGLIGWESLITGTDVNKFYSGSNTPSSETITKVANGILSNGAEVTDSGTTLLETDNGIYKKTVNAGAYIAIISGGTDYIYNPVLVAASYNENSVLTPGPVSATDKYLHGATAVAKKSPVSIEKEISSGTTPDVSDNESSPIETVSVGSLVGYTITPTIPSYPAEAVDKTLFVSDTMETGLEFRYDTLGIKLTSEGSDPIELIPTLDTTGKKTFNFPTSNTDPTQNLKVAEAVSTNEIGTGGGFNICFNYDALIKDTAGNVYTPVITYKARVTEEAVIGKDGNTNTVELIYATKPTEGVSWNTTTKPTPEEQTDKGFGHKEDKEVVYTYQLAFHKKGEGADEQGLQGAIFGIYEDEGCTKMIDCVSTNEKGYAQSHQVGKGKYWVKELTAPDGYTINDNKFSIEATWATAKYTTTSTETEVKYTTTKPAAPNDKQVGWLLGGKFYNIDQYTTAGDPEGLQAAYIEFARKTTNQSSEIKTNDAATGNGVAIYGKDEVGHISNTKIKALPSTGGIGTTIFTIGGCIIMIAAAALFFASRKKSSK